MTPLSAPPRLIFPFPISLAHLRTIANFGGTLEQARELAQKGLERVEGMK